MFMFLEGRADISAGGGQISLEGRVVIFGG